jgi:5'-3' exonuclease
MNDDLEPIDIAIIDADSMVYEIACVSNNRQKNKVSLLAKIENVITGLQARTAYVYIKGVDNFRYQCTDDYKANRKDNLTPEQKESLALLYEDAKEYCTSSDGAEADDYCGIMAEYCRSEGLSFVISHIDKDLNMLQGHHHNFRKNEVYTTDKEYSYRFLMKQLLTGDAADNIKGLWKVGPVGAGKIVDPVPVERVFQEVLNTWLSKSSLEEFTKCANLIWIRDITEDLRPLTFEELNERFTWKTPDIGLHSPTDPEEPTDSSTTSPTMLPEEVT